MRFLLIVTGWNCKDQLERCYKSIRNQEYKNFRAIFILDGATDGGESILQTAVTDPRFTVEIHKENMGAAYRRFYAIHRYGQDDDVVVLVGMDDRLMQDALTTIKTKYVYGAWMTYGNWIDQKGETLPEGFLQFDQVTHNNRNYRKVKYRSTAPNTFYKFLFDQIPAEDFQINGKWIDSTTESPVMFACLEMCGQSRIGVIEKPIYFYNRNLPNGTLCRLGTQYKYRIYDHVIAQPKKHLLKERPMKQEETTPTKTTMDKWKSATKNLQDRRDAGQTNDNAACENIVADYDRHLRSFPIGESLLDVGCGDQALGRALARHNERAKTNVKYFGVDAFPVSAAIPKLKIENDKEVDALLEDHGQFDTVCCFAALDSMHDLVKATENMKRCANQRVVFLTGINIAPDKFHTFEITVKLLDELMVGFKRGKCFNFLTPKVLLAEYVRA